MKVMSERIAMILSIIAFGMSLVFQIANAEIFKRVDDKGTAHFTEDPSTIPEKYREQAGKYQRENERTREKKGHEEVTQGAIETWYRQQSFRNIDLMEKLVRDFPEISYVWTQEMSLWIKGPAAYTMRDVELCKVIAEIVAQHYRERKGHMVCVHIYYGKFKEVTRVCR